MLIKIVTAIKTLIIIITLLVRTITIQQIRKTNFYLRDSSLHNTKNHKSKPTNQSVRAHKIQAIIQTKMISKILLSNKLHKYKLKFKTSHKTFKMILIIAKIFRQNNQFNQDKVMLTFRTIKIVIVTTIFLVLSLTSLILVILIIIIIVTAIIIVTTIVLARVIIMVMIMLLIIISTLISMI